MQLRCILTGWGRFYKDSLEGWSHGRVFWCFSWARDCGTLTYAGLESSPISKQRSIFLPQTCYWLRPACEDVSPGPLWHCRGVNWTHGTFSHTNPARSSLTAPYSPILPSLPGLLSREWENDAAQSLSHGESKDRGGKFWNFQSTIWFFLCSLQSSLTAVSR